MRRIGLIGGMSWESTAVYYRLINEGVRDRLGDLHSARVLIDSVDFADVEMLQADGRWDDAGDMLADSAQRLVAGGAEVLALCTNTMHKVSEAVTDTVDVPFVHLADVTGEAVRAAGLGRVGLLGTAFTMEQDFYRDRLASHGLDVLVPDEDDRATVHRIIYEELCRGVARDESRQRFRDVTARLVDSGAHGVILGCTEIELLVGQEDATVPVFPTTTIHAAAIVDAAI